MSFGFSVGDLIGGANLTYQLIKALHGSQDAGQEYREAIEELGCVQQALIRVSCLGSNPNFARATFESASNIIMGSMKIIESFLDRTKKYDRKLGHFGASSSRASFSHNWRKVGWTLFKADEMKKLRETLHARLSSLAVLLAAANLDNDDVTTHYMGGNRDTFKLDAVDNPGSSVPSTMQPQSNIAESIDSGIGDEDVHQEFSKPFPAEGEKTVTNPKQGSSVAFLQSFSSVELIALVTDRTAREEEVKKVGHCLRTLINIGGCQVVHEDRKLLLKLLDQICGDQDVHDSSAPRAPIKFKDAVGRKFSFPWQLCKTWKGMEELIKQAFLHVEVIGPHVHEGHYDLVGPDGEIILPQVWDIVVQPDWAITMHMWPMPEPPPTTTTTTTSEPVSPTIPLADFESEG